MIKVIKWYRDLISAAPQKVRKWQNGVSTRPSRPAIPDGRRVYAIGDVHGRLDLLQSLIDAIVADGQTRSPVDTQIIMLGDLIDRGPDSAGVISYLREIRERVRMRFLLGNHEEMFLLALQNKAALRSFIEFGGRETLLSYSISRADYDSWTVDELYEVIKEIIPREHIDFIQSFEDIAIVGDYIFVHAGIRPGTCPGNQAIKDLRWIREPFLSFQGQHGHCVVHGHTVTDGVEIKPNRIGIDTGAYKTGRLTALGLEGVSSWFIECTADSSTARNICLSG